MKVNASEVTPEILLELFTEIADPWIAQLENRSCVAAVRILQQCLETFGVKVEPRPVYFTIQIKSLEIGYMCGLRPDQVKGQPKSWIPASPLRTGTGWNGHLVALVDKQFLVDPSFDAPFIEMQLAGKLPSYERSGTLVLPLGREIEHNFAADILGRVEELEVEVRYGSTADDSYLQAPAWELDHIQPLIDKVVVRMLGNIGRG